jgi:transcriptional regulator with XRE-family HTH domain
MLLARWGKERPTNASDVGRRIYELRTDRDEPLSQGALAALCPPGPRGPRSYGWIANFESGVQVPDVDALFQIAQALQVDPVYLLVGERKDSELVSRLREMEPLMDERGQRTVLLVAEQQVEEARRAQAQDDAFDLIKRQMLAAGVDPETIHRAVQQAQATVRQSAGDELAERPA